MPTVITVDNVQTVVATQSRAVVNSAQAVQTVQVASLGPQGPAGVAGDAYDTRIAATTLGGHRVVRTEADGRIGYADATDTTHGDDTVGLTVGAANENEEVNVQRSGSLAFNGWSWTPGEPVFLSTTGTMTQVPPTAAGGAAFSQVIGHAETATTLFINPQPPIYF